MAVKCVTCDLMFRNDSQLGWHVRQEHMNKRVRPDPAKSAQE